MPRCRFGHDFGSLSYDLELPEFLKGRLAGHLLLLDAQAPS